MKLATFILDLLKSQKSSQLKLGISSEAKKSFFTLNFHNISYEKIERWSEGQIALSSKNFWLLQSIFVFMLEITWRKKYQPPPPSSSLLIEIFQIIITTKNQKEKGLMSFSK